jgi:hypothetical protein
MFRIKDAFYFVFLCIYGFFLATQQIFESNEHKNNNACIASFGSINFFDHKLL